MSYSDFDMYLNGTPGGDISRVRSYKGLPMDHYVNPDIAVLQVVQGEI